MHDALKWIAGGALGLGLGYVWFHDAERPRGGQGEAPVAAPTPELVGGGAARSTANPDVAPPPQPLERAYGPGPPGEAHMAVLRWLHRLDGKRFGLWRAQDLAQLRELDLSRTLLDPADLKHLASLTGLVSLNLRGTGITDRSLDEIAKLTNLKRLDLTSTLVTDDGLRKLADLDDLQHLELNYTGITDAGLSTVAQHTALTRLMLDGTKITDDGLAKLKGLPLESLAIGATQVGDKGLEHLDAFALKELSLYRNRQITDHGFRHLEGQKSLETLNLRAMNLSSDGLATLRHLSSLRDLNASGNVMNDAALRHLADLKSLRRLGLYSNKDITDAGVAHLRGLQGLEAVQLQFTGITDKGLLHLQDLPRIRSLDLRGTGVAAGAQAFRDEHPDCVVWR